MSSFIIIDSADETQAVDYGAGNRHLMFGFWTSRDRAYRFPSEASARSFMVCAPYGIDKRGRIVPVEEEPTHGPEAYYD